MLFTSGYKILPAVVKARDAVVCNYAAGESGENCSNEGELHGGKLGLVLI